MKYDKMLCWLFEDDEKRLKDLNPNIPIVYVNSKEEFISNISSDTYNVFSLRLAEDDNNDFIDIMEKFRDYTFHLFANYDGDLTIPEFDLANKYENKLKVYLVEELIEDYLKGDDSYENRNL